MVAGIRVIGLNVQRTYDFTWACFWLYIEACVAVSMISLTAFRSLFASDGSRPSDPKSPPWRSFAAPKAQKPNRFETDEQNLHALPTIPSATLSGMRTMIRGRPTTTNPGYDDDCSEIWPLQVRGPGKGKFQEV